MRLLSITYSLTVALTKAIANFFNQHQLRHMGKARKIRGCKEVMAEVFTELGVKPFSSLTPDTSVARFNHSTFNKRPWQGITPAGGRALLKNMHSTVTL